ncbi:MAG: hypothetical protein AAGC93_25910 [Cyanobacteria bacterium P01_F01_bin.53]
MTQQLAPSAESLSTLKKQFRINSFGLRLFAMIMGGTLVGIGGMAFLFGETVKFQAEEQIRNTLESKVAIIDDVIDQAETLAYGLGVSVSTLHVRGAQTPGTYQELTRQLFQGSPEFVIGLGVGQKEYGILPSLQWFFPSYKSPSMSQLPPGDSGEKAGQQSSGALSSQALSLQSSGTYRNLADEENFYPETSQYKDYFLPQENRWTTPYSSDRGTLLTYYSQVFDDRNQWLGTAVVDLDGTHLSTVLDGPIFRDGGRLLLLTESGEVVANPQNPDELSNQTYKDIPDLAQVWEEMSLTEPGFIEGESGYWSYTHIPEQNWRVLAYVPYSTVFGPIVLITLGATTLVGLLLAGLTGLAIQYLNRRLRPMIDECQRLAEVEGELSPELQNKDELEQLSLSFFNLLDQLQLSQSQVQQEAAHAIDAEEKLRQVRAKAVANQMRQQLTTQKLEDQTSAQVLSALNHFSSMLDSLNQVSDQVHTLEQSVTRTQDDTHKQSSLMGQLQQNLNTTDQLSRALVASVGNVDEAGSIAQAAMTASQQAAAEITSELTQFKPKIKMLAEGMQRLFEATDLVAQDTRKHQRLANSAKVILLNASTLSISASQRRSPKDFVQIVSQFRDKETQLHELAEQLEDSRNKQQVRVSQLQEIVSGLRRELGTFDHSVQLFSNTVESSQSALKKGQTAVKQVSREQAQMTNSGQELADLGQTIQQTIQEMSAIAEATQNRIELSCHQTSKLDQLTEEMRESTAILLKQAEEHYAAEVVRLSA